VVHIRVKRKKFDKVSSYFLFTGAFLIHPTEIIPKKPDKKKANVEISGNFNIF
jgi:hypothetical protein